MNEETSDTKHDYSLEGLVDWRPIEKALEEKTQSGYKLAIIETHKIVDLLLEEKKFPGKNFEQRYKRAKYIFTNKEKTEYAITMYRKILEERNFDLEPNDVKDIIAAYYQSMIDIKEYSPRKHIGIIRKLQLVRGEKTTKITSMAKWIGIILAIFFFIVFLIDNTHIGKVFALTIAGIANFIFTKLIIIVAIVFVFLLLLFASFHHLKKRKEVEQNKETEEENTK